MNKEREYKQQRSGIKYSKDLLLTFTSYYTFHIPIIFSWQNSTALEEGGIHEKRNILNKEREYKGVELNIQKTFC